jgi:hypothetical protein
MSDMMSRRSLITGMISLAVTAPAIVRAANLMPVKLMIPTRGDWLTESRMFPFIGEFEDHIQIRFARRLSILRYATAGLGHRFDPIEAFGWNN